ncbi:MAG TPA: AarF/UbiB family protein [Chthoniobacteraceae bacterium]|nr:AarF/UbiB family protein [Chthoniobacteraceae bacterium]
MALLTKPAQLNRYKDIAAFLFKYRQGHLLKESPLIDDPLDFAEPAPQSPDAKEFVSDLEKLGPTFIKLGQLLSTRADFIPTNYMEALSRLQDDVEPFSFEQVEAIVAVEIGARISRAFQKFENLPMAAASLGQVHRAILRDGREVAVKVQRPDVREKVADDLEVLQTMAEFLDTHTDVGRRYEFSRIVEELRKALIQELDYRLEAANLRSLGQKLSGYKRIFIPQPVEDYSTGRVLTMDLVSGIKVTKITGVHRLDIDTEALAEELFQAYLQQILVDGLFHADPHPGNVFLTDDHRIALLDLGMVGRAGVELQDQLLKLLLAISEGQGNRAADVAIAIGEPKDEFDEAKFRRRLAEVVAGQGMATLENMQVGKVVMGVNQIAAECGIRIPSELTMVGKTLLNLDMVGRTLAPDFDPNESIRRNAVRIMHQRSWKSLSLGNLLSALIDTKELVEKLPSRINQFTELVAGNKVRIKIDSIDENLLMAGLQKIANRITLGLILAALIVGASMLMRIQTAFTIFGYPGLAILFFLGATVGAIVLIVAIIRSDRTSGRK